MDRARAPVEELRRTLCNRDCPDACAIVATVRDGRVVALAGDREHPVTQGFLCHRTNQFLRTQYSPDRLDTPLVRDDGGTLRKASWDEALSFIADKLTRIKRESGPSAVFHYRSGGTLGMVTAAASELFFEQFGPVTVKRGDICSGAGEAAQEADFGVSDSGALSGLEKARNIFLWGKNVATSSPHLIPVLARARAGGANLVCIDPLANRSVKLCDRFVQLRPAGDLALAMATLAVVFERGFVDADAASYCVGLDRVRQLAMSRTVSAWCALADVSDAVAVELAERLHDGPTTILVGWGMARRAIGGAIVRALDALAAITGNVGRAGAGVSYYYRRRRAFVSPARGVSARTLSEPLFGQEVLAATSPPVRAIWITAGNPVAMLPDSAAVARALKTRELVVVVDSWLSDTAEHAHVVLPTTTLLEADELLGAYGHHQLGVARPVVPPPSEVKSDLEIFQALADKLGLGSYPQDDARAWKARMLSPELVSRGVTLAALERGVVNNPLAEKTLFSGRVFPTPSGKVELMSALPEDAGVRYDPEFPLFLMSVSSPRSQSSQWAKAPPRPAEVTVHPDAAAGVKDGEIARLESRMGTLTVRVRHDASQRRDVAILPKGGHYRDGAAANAITTARLTDLGEGGALYDERVRIVPAA
ncbi:MAG: molybdopterin-containing oxidoreductase catalytic subunit [Myxococcales bacterium]|nr:molybdopterin-containing oxidoreductase catalytic subunit [Myxococcales bacterium]